MSLTSKKRNFIFGIAFGFITGIALLFIFKLGNYSLGWDVIDGWSNSCKFYSQLSYSDANVITEEVCNKIPENCGHTDLIFNPAGSQVFYLRSQCFLRLALKTSDEKYCEKVIELKIPLPWHDGGGYTPENCIKLIRGEPIKYPNFGIAWKKR